jgi:hypothetical protein
MPDLCGGVHPCDEPVHIISIKRSAPATRAGLFEPSLIGSHSRAPTALDGDGDAKVDGPNGPLQQAYIERPASRCQTVRGHRTEPRALTGW